MSPALLCQAAQWPGDEGKRIVNISPPSTSMKKNPADAGEWDWRMQFGHIVFHRLSFSLRDWIDSGTGWCSDRQEINRKVPQSVWKEVGQPWTTKDL